MERLGKILGPAMRQLQRPEAVLAWLRAVWPRIAGAQVAAHTRPARWNSGILEISVNSSEWQTPIAGLEAHISQRIQQFWGGPLVREVRIVRGPDPLRPKYKENDNAHTPFIRKKAGGGGKRDRS